MYDIIIVGAGPAGLTAAIYALRANRKVLIFEAKSYGGQILNANKVENYPGIMSISGYDFATNLYNQVKELGGEFKFETVLKVTEDKEVTTSSGTYKAKSVILATGAENRRLNIDGEKDLIGKGISYCATCDGNLYKNKVVAVVGGGNTALEDALYLTNLAKEVYLIHRRDSFRGEGKYLSELKKKENVNFILNSNVVKVYGEEKLESIDIKDSEDNIINKKVDGLFIAVGQEPKNSLFSNVVTLNDSGYIETKDEVYSNVEGIYVAGDNRVKTLRQLTTAVSDGSIAATIAIKEMKKD